MAFRRWAPTSPLLAPALLVLAWVATSSARAAPGNDIPQGRPAAPAAPEAAAGRAVATDQQPPGAQAPRPRAPKPRPDGPEIATRAALLLARAQAAALGHRLDQAETLLAAAEALGADQATVLLWRARIALERKDWGKADSLYEKLADLRPEDAAVQLTLAKLDLKTGKLIWAMRRFQAAARNPRLAGAALLGLAETLVRMEEFADALEQALAATKKAKTETTRRRAMALVTLCRYKLGQIAPARQAILSSGDLPVTRRLEGLLMERLTGPQGAWSLHLSTGLGTDSNPTMGPEPTPGWTGKDQAALDISLKADAAWRPIRRPRHLVVLQGSMTRHFYVAPWDKKTGEQIAAFDMTTLTLTGDYFHRRLTAAGTTGFRLGYRYDLVELDGGVGIPSEPSAFLYSEKHRLVAGWERRWDQATMDLRLEPAYAAFRDRDRDGPSVSLVANGSRFFLGQRLRLYARGALEWSHAKWKPWRWLGLGLWAAASYLAPWDLDLVAWTSYDFHDHWQSKDAFPAPGANAWGLPSGRVRRDHLLTLAVGLGRRVDSAGRWRLDLNLRYQTSRSTASFYTYSRLVALFSVTGHLGG